MTDTLVERVARAISIPQHHTTWDILTEREKDLFLMQAEYAVYEINSVLTAGLALEALKTISVIAGLTLTDTEHDEYRGVLEQVARLAEGTIKALSHSSETSK